MSRDVKGTHEKALQINLDLAKYGTFAEIGAGQEVARWFFRVGAAAGTIAKSISAYDMTFSDAIYGPCERYVSRQRLQTMLDHEYDLLIERLNAKRGDSTKFFVFANTVTARAYKGNNECHGWMGVQVQLRPRTRPCQMLIHVRMLDRENVQQQEALGIIGVNLVYASFYLNDQPEDFIASLLDGLSTDRIEVDMVRFSGPDFVKIDNRLLSLQLIKVGLTKSALFSPEGEVLQPADVLYKKAILLERGQFRPVTRINLEMMETARTQFLQEPKNQGEHVLEIMEISMRNLLRQDSPFDTSDLLARVDALGVCNKTVLISNYAEFHRLGAYLNTFSKKMIGITLSIPLLKELFEEKYYVDLEGGILESFGRLFKNELKLYIYPARHEETGEIISADNLRVASHLQHLYAYLLENNFIMAIRSKNPGGLRFNSNEVTQRIANDDPTWESLVVPRVADLIKERGYFGYRPPLPTESV